MKLFESIKVEEKFGGKPYIKSKDLFLEDDGKGWKVTLSFHGGWGDDCNFHCVSMRTRSLSGGENISLDMMEQIVKEMGVFEQEIENKLEGEY